MNLLKFWPTETNCLECIKPEAENPSDAVFLAVHQEMRFIRKSFRTDKAQNKSQKQLINEFLKDEPSGRVILPILGESGIGKSHLIRWLDVQLRQREDRDQRHVIRIPKSSSLKSVLGRILDGLEGPHYEKIRRQLRAAREQMDDIGAKQRIRAELLAAIERKHTTASERKEKRKSSGGKPSKEDQLWLKHGDPRCLPALLNDPATGVLFMQGTSTRPGIISELARHITKDTSEVESPRRQFSAEDFGIPKELADEIKEAGPIASRYLTQKLLRTTSSDALEEAVSLLNSIVDDAIAPLATPTDTSLSELFYDVRRQLLTEERELVLLVEDFAVLAGVQKALLDAIIREGETGGKTEACTIRTALAVTDGYFVNLQTVETRAVHGWWFASGENETEETVTNQIGNFVAAYINAARIGAKQLESHYGKSANIGKKAPNAIEFLPLETEEQSALASFGESVDEYSLFPFNQNAIRTIADWRLRDQQGRLKFNPRSVISEIILPVLKDNRINLERSAFPPENFLGFPNTRFSAQMNLQVERKESNPIRREQYMYLLHFWGGQPQDLNEMNLPAGVYQAFGLPVINVGKRSDQPEKLKPYTVSDAEENGKVDEVNTVKVTDDREPDSIRRFVKKLEEWRGGDRLGQGDANKIRIWINSHLLHSINWEAELLRSLNPETKTYATRIHLPRSSGNPPSIDNAFIVVSTDNEFNDAAVANPIFFAVRAMLRYDYYKGWNYEQSDEDYIFLANFIDEHISNAVKWISTRYKHVHGSPVASLTQALLWQARQLNVEASHKTDDVNLVYSVFADTPENGKNDDDLEWNNFIGQLTSYRKILQDQLLEHIGAFQGAGKTPHAIDASQLLDIVASFGKKWEVTEKFPQLPNNPLEEVKAAAKHIQLLARSGNSTVEKRRQRIARQSSLIVAELGKDYDKNTLLNNLAEVCTLSEQHGLKGDVKVPQIRNLIERFQNARVKEVSAQVEAIVSGEHIPARMTAIARLDLETHSLLVEFCETCAKFLNERAGEADDQISTWSVEVVETKTAEVDIILKELEDAVIPYRKAEE